MDYPVEKWKFYVSQKWASLEPSLKEKLRQPILLRDSFSLSLSLFQHEDEEYLFNLSRSYCVTKDAKLGLSCKEEGNQKFRKKEYRTAAVLYSRALSHVEAGSTDMAVCYANRSAALFHLGQFEVCLEDIKRAQEGGYPERLWPKILLRKAECLFTLGRLQDMADALASMENQISADHNLDGTGSHRDLLCKLQQLKIKARKEGSGLVSQPAAPRRTPSEPEPWNRNSRIPCASSSVSLAFSLCKGRHLVAAKDILPGEILVKEEAFVSVLRPGKGLLSQGSAGAALDGQLAPEDLHCHHCLKAVLASVPCQSCSYAKYCSPQCAQLAWNGYHSRECSLGGLLLLLGVFCHTALRAVLVAGFAQVRRLVKQSHIESLAEAPGPGMVTEGDLASIPGCDAEGRYSSSYQTTFSLLAHTDRHSPELRFLCSLSVAGLCKAFEAPDLEAIVDEKDASGSQEEPPAAGASSGLEVLGEAMLRHMLQLPCNAQAVVTLSASGSEEGPVTGNEEIALATALFPVISLLNHSCDPNTSVAFSGRTMEVRASHPIPFGQEILHCYGPHHCRMGASERQERLLSQYFFECQCRSCSKELNPSSKGIPSAQPSLFCCPACHLPMQGQGMLCCSSRTCKTQVLEETFQLQLRDLQRLTQRALKLLEQGEAGKSMELLQKCQMEAKKFLSPVHLLMGEIEDHMAQAQATLGRWHEASGHLRSSIRVVEAHFGSSSIEVGQELFKLAQVLFNGCAVSEALEATEKAEVLLSLHLGSQSAQVQELQEMKACLEDLLGGGDAVTAARS
ncbi:protein-lysine N-methyltransferase SMYD4 isoform X1 [Pogona vitticeps]